MVENNGLIAPHGGTLIDLMVIDEAKRYDLVEKAKTIPKWELDERGLADLECIATGVYSPLTGFAVEADYESILKSMRLSTGLIWPIPIICAVAEDVVLCTHEFEGRADPFRFRILHPLGEISIDDRGDRGTIANR